MVDLRGKGPRGPVASPANESGGVGSSVSIPAGGSANTSGFTTAQGKKPNGRSGGMSAPSLGFETNAKMETGGVDLRTGFSSRSAGQKYQSADKAASDA